MITLERILQKASSIKKRIIREAFITEKQFFRSERRRGIRYYHYRKGDFSLNKNKHRLIWQLHGMRLFISCVGCGGINEVKLRLVNSPYYHGNWRDTYTVARDGYVQSEVEGAKDCLTCPVCNSHFFAKLKGWEVHDQR